MSRKEVCTAPVDTIAHRWDHFLCPSGDVDVCHCVVVHDAAEGAHVVVGGAVGIKGSDHRCDGRKLPCQHDLSCVL